MGLTFDILHDKNLLQDFVKMSQEFCKRIIAPYLDRKGPGLSLYGVKQCEKML